MTAEKVSMFLAMHQKDLPLENLPLIKERLEAIPDERFLTLSCIPFKDVTTNVVLSVLLGGCGVDRFMVGDIGLGVLKLLTGGLCGVMTVIDWFLIAGRTKEKNYEMLAPYLV